MEVFWARTPYSELESKHGTIVSCPAGRGGSREHTFAVQPQGNVKRRGWSTAKEEVKQAAVAAGFGKRWSEKGVGRGCGKHVGKQMRGAIRGRRESETWKIAKGGILFENGIG